MKAERHQGGHLTYLSLLPDEYKPDHQYPLVILLHGFGANMQDLAGLAPVINSRGYLYACPNAPIPFDLGLGQSGYGWFPPQGRATPEDIKQAEDLLGGFFDEVLQQFHVPPRQAILMGFSQGGGMTYRCGLGRADTFAGLAALSASLPNPQELEPKLPVERSQPIFISHGLNDPLIPADSARTAREFLQGAGYSLEYHEYSMGHEISGEVLADLVPWMTKVLPPSPPGQ